MYEAKLEFSEGLGGGGGGGGVIQQIPSNNNKVYFCGGYGYFLEPHISKKQDARCTALKQIIFFKKGGKWDL